MHRKVLHLLMNEGGRGEGTGKEIWGEDEGGVD